MKIFLLKLRVGDGKYVSRIEILRKYDWSYTDVFMTLDLAHAHGTAKLRGHLTKLKDSFPSYKNKTPEAFAEKKLKDDYSFRIVEFDSDVERDMDWHRDWGLGQWKYFTLWEYDCLGNLTDRLECVDGIGYERLPGDEAEDAGTKFAVGDFVTADREYLKDQVLVVKYRPGRKSDCERPETWENIYSLLSLTGHEHVHESEIRPHEGPAPKDGDPLTFLRGVATGEISLSENEWHDVYFFGIPDNFGIVDAERLTLGGKNSSEGS
jgi:hypothetical protein